MSRKSWGIFRKLFRGWSEIVGGHRKWFRDSWRCLVNVEGIVGDCGNKS